MGPDRAPGPRSLKPTERHGHFLNLTGRHGPYSDSDMGPKKIVTWDTAIS